MLLIGTGLTTVDAVISLLDQGHTGPIHALSRRRFLRHLRPWWDVHRHRMAGAVSVGIDAAIASNQLRISVGRIRDYAIRHGMVDALYRPRGRETPDIIRVARVVNCSGPVADYERIQEPLIKSLLGEGVIRPDPLKLGLDVTANCALLDRKGAISRRLFAVGPVTKGAFWEMTAVPDVRRQTELVAECLAGLIRNAPPAAASHPVEQRG